MTPAGVLSPLVSRLLQKNRVLMSAGSTPVVMSGSSVSAVVPSELDCPVSTNTRRWAAEPVWAKTPDTPINATRQYLPTMLNAFLNAAEPPDGSRPEGKDNAVPRCPAMVP